MIVTLMDTHYLAPEGWHRCFDDKICHPYGTKSGVVILLQS